MTSAAEYLSVLDTARMEIGIAIWDKTYHPYLLFCGTVWLGRITTHR